MSEVLEVVIPELSLTDLILNEVKTHPGITSPEICAKYPHIQRGTVTSKISKLKGRNLIFSEETPSRVGQTLKLFPACPVVQGAIKVQAKLTPLIPVGYTKEDILAVLRPFAEFASKMNKNGVSGTLNVWLSATTLNPTVGVAPGSWFIDALALLKKMA